MIVRSPPPKRRAPPSNDQIVQRSSADLFALPQNHYNANESSSPGMLCTYQCRQMVKSEVLEDLGMREKEVVDLQSRVESLEEDNSNKDLQKTKLEGRIQQMEQELAAANAREKAVQEQFSKELKEFQECLQTRMKQSSALEMKLQHEMKLRAETESVATIANDKVTMLEEKMKKSSDVAKSEIASLKSEILRMQKESDLAVLRFRAEIERETCRANSSEQEVELLMKQYDDLKGQLSECLNKKTELEQELSNTIAAAQGSSIHENDTIVKNLQEELRHYEAEVAEARKLKIFHVNAELLREKLLEEKQRADRAESAIECLPELQLKIIDLENQLKSWRSMIGDLPGIDSPDDVPRKISDLQKEAVGNMAKVGEMAISLKELKAVLEKEEYERLQANKQAASAREEVEAAMSNIGRLERKIALLSKERDGLKAIISSYDEEEAVGLKRQKLGDASALEKSKNKRIQELEASLSRSVSNIKQLEQDLIEQGESLKSQRRKSEFLAQEVDDALRKIKALEREGDRLRCEIATYESKLGHGDFNHATTKVLHMVNTLGTHNQEKDTKESLQLDLQRLQAKLRAIEDRKGNLEDGRSTNTLISEEASQLKAQIATLEKREERYKKVFAEKISVFRLACCSLFGYKIQMDEQQRPSGIPVTLFTLQSIYALSDDDKLEFEYESGNMNLQMNEYTSQPEISREVDVFLHKFHSIPAFTANLTVELFNRSTMT
ncbi:hypothetical protein SUGI_0029980 [Cryptomeria japonica]|uniref:mitotic spindle checkpoint protein MAD1 n=1 Tax=Cryptomeria japonica TaxID=3369 RepID=UPI002408E31E|nr:mitotic spindle checkpoint protein MAD1 [Cryptomeria japonica]GLJ05987.1 hypothetical protein SUGI_0029980 [Cryptomeria japonica]